MELPTYTNIWKIEKRLYSRPKGFRIFLEKILYLVSKHQTPQVIQRLQAPKTNIV